MDRRYNELGKGMLDTIKKLISERSQSGASGASRNTPLSGAREDMGLRLGAAGLPMPTEDQFSMILSDAPSTRVVAGAGSGKSTTLVLRCIYLHVYRAIPWEQITVVTFTRNSRRDFVKKLSTYAKRWDIDLSEKALSRIVRTFHSLAFSQATTAGIHTATIDRPTSTPSTASATGADLPFAPLAVTEDSELALMLNEVACELMRDDEVFRLCVMQMYDASFIAAGATVNNDPVREKRISVVQANDQDRTAYMESVWRERFAPDLMKNSLVSFEPGRFLIAALRKGNERDIANGPWWANAYVPELKAWAILGVSAQMAQGQYMPDGFSMGAALAAKKSCVNVFTSTTPIIWINTPEDLMRLHHRLLWDPAQAIRFPKFNVRLTGEAMPAPLLIALWQQAQFIQSLGLDVRLAGLKAHSNTSGVDALFSCALSRFWPEFERALARRGLSTSNGVFERLAQTQTMEKMPTSILDCCSHLLIDEFQDISGNIVKWLVAVRAELKRRNVNTSLTVVGDDWQSIYGWRGASPRYFTQFDSYFNSRGGRRCRTIMLNENFRSSQNIIDAAQAMIAGVTEKIDKQGIASGEHANAEDRVHLGVFQGTHALAENGDEIFPSNTSAFVLARTNGALAAWRTGRALGMTIHGSKGLEADYVLMIEDFTPPGHHPLRRVWYELADLGDYDQAQRDETHRLAYVAITRAKKGCVWLVPEQSAEGMFGVLLRSHCGAVSQGDEVG